MGKYNMHPRKLIQLLRKNGFVFLRQNGSHAVFRNEIANRKVVVPMHSKNIPNGTLHAILKDVDIEI